MHIKSSSIMFLFPSAPWPLNKRFQVFLVYILLVSSAFLISLLHDLNEILLQGIVELQPSIFGNSNSFQEL